MEVESNSCATGKLEQAILYATLSHRQQKDKGGQPYILHPLSVLFRVRHAGETEVVQIAAVLHDVVEDTPVTLQEIESNFGPVIAEALDALTRRQGEPYEQYLFRLRANPIALKVKVEDLHDNLDPTRQQWAKDATSLEKLRRLQDRYRSALQLLTNSNSMRSGREQG